MRDYIEFWHRGRSVRIDQPDPTRTVLRYLREDRRLTGTKEGCAEGDCGACTVLLGELQGGAVRYRAVNACIQFLPTLDGRHLVTVEDLAKSAKALHPVQEAMVKHHGSQCGFCTPGFVMSLAGLGIGKPAAGREDVLDAIAGNLCRCTGYGPIVDAGLEAAPACTSPVDEATIEALQAMQTRPAARLRHGGQEYFAPKKLEDALEWLADHPDATVLAGGTDVGLWVTKQHRDLGHILYTGRIAELLELEASETALVLGAAVTYADARGALGNLASAWTDLIRRIGATQVWNAGTVGGNIANGSPIGDSPPALIALGASITLASRDGERHLPLEDYFIEYGKQDRRGDELLVKIQVPVPHSDEVVRFYKVSKRFDQDISALLGAFAYRLDDQGNVARIRAAYGGMAATPKRAHQLEKALIGKAWSQETIEHALPALEQDFAPIDDMRASAWYRMQAAKNLVLRLFAESQAREPTQLFGHAEATYGRR